MKKSLIVGVILIAMLILYTFIQLELTKQKISMKYTDISMVESINTNGHWGEWFSEYILIVETTDEIRYRIWVNQDGDITDQEVLR